MNEYFTEVESNNQEFQDRTESYIKDLSKLITFPTNEYLYTLPTAAAPGVDEWLLHENAVKWIVDFLKEYIITFDRCEYIIFEYFVRPTKNTIQKKSLTIQKSEGGQITTRISDASIKKFHNLVYALEFDLLPRGTFKAAQYSYFFHLTGPIDFIQVSRQIISNAQNRQTKKFLCDGFWGFKKFLIGELDVIGEQSHSNS